jgi:hypothetical protein
MQILKPTRPLAIGCGTAPKAPTKAHCGSTSTTPPLPVRRPTSPSYAPRSETRYFLNSYHPLCETEAGRRIAVEHGVPPFVDYSIRREPDFQNEYPSITGLCRCDKLVGQVQEGDFIAYVTVLKAGPRRLVAILKVLHKLRTHEVAADWYRRKQLPLPTNCVVPENSALPLSLAVLPSPSTKHEDWELGYEARAKSYPTFLICRAVEGPNLSDPPIVEHTIFGRPFPNTRSPKRLTEGEFTKLRQLLQ